MVEPGDIILIKTPSVIYSGMRNFFHIEYDHALVVVDKERCLHISYPRAKLVPVWSYLQISKEPIIIKPTVQKDLKNTPSYEHLQHIHIIKK